MEELKLKPCPFCGARAVVAETKYPRRYHPYCENADCIMAGGARWFKKMDEAVKAWNKISGPDKGVTLK